LLEGKFKDRSRAMSSWIHLVYKSEGHLLFCSSTEAIAVTYSWTPPRRVMCNRNQV